MDHESKVRYVKSHAQGTGGNQRLDLVVFQCNFGAVAFPHNLEGSMGTRTLTIDGQPTPYGAQIGWPGVATLPHLPATSVPIATDPSGLPIGVQVIGAHLEDRTTLAVARMIAAA